MKNKKVKTKSIKSSDSEKKIKNTDKKNPPADKVFLRKMIEDLLPQMAEKILRRAQSMGQVLQTRKRKKRPK